MRPSSLLRYHESLPGRIARARGGRVLVECCVSMTLLAAASALVLLATANTAHLVDASRQRDRVLRAGATHLSQVIAAPCLIGTAAMRVPVGTRAVLDVRQSDAAALRVVQVEAWWLGSPFGRAAWHPHTTITGGWCE